MKGMPFYIVDVFAEEKYAGNQLAVVRNAKRLTTEEMQKIAVEMNYSETTFIMAGTDRGSGFDVRIFTQAMEVPFAGHPTLGTAYVIQKEIVKNPQKLLNLNLKIGQIPVTMSYEGNDVDILWMRQVQPSFGRVFKARQIAEVLNIEEDDIDKEFPIQEVSTGLPFIIVPLKTLDSVKRCIVSKEKLFEMVKNTEAKAVLVFCPETFNRENDLNVRVFVDYYGVPEDPATGSANGCLAGYLVEYRYFNSDCINVCVEQGYELGRKSALLLKASKDGDGIDILVGGRVVMTARGELV